MENEERNSEVSAHLQPKKNDDENYKELNTLLEKTAAYSQFLSEQLSSSLAESTTDSNDVVGNKRKRTENGGSDSLEKPADKKLRNLMGKETPTKGAVQPNIVTGGTLRSYQLNGLNWLISLYENGVNGILADEMGLGKTIQTIALLGHIYENVVRGPFLVVAPLSTLANWIKEFQKWAPSINVIMYHGSKEERASFRRTQDVFFKKGVGTTNDWEVVITSYDIAMNDLRYLKKIKWHYLVVDEAHRLKNLNCKLIMSLRKLHTQNRLLLTGTPIQNKLEELWSLLNFLLPAVFDDLDQFQSWFDFSGVGDSSTEKSIIDQERHNKIVSKLHSILRPFLLRRLKAEVDLTVPEKREIVLYTPLTSVQKDYYLAVRNKDFSAIDQKHSTGTSTKRLLNIIMQLRKVCNHPFLFRDFDSEKQPHDPEHRKYLKELISSSGKVSLLEKMLPKLRKNNHKVLLFSQMTRMLDILEDYLVLKKYSYCRIDGSVGQADREKQIEQFNNGKETFCFLLSTRAGGLGINLTSADTVIIYDSDWNPQMDLQAQDRCHRIGQTENVCVYRLITANTVERRILSRAASKLKLERLVIEKGNFKGHKSNTGKGDTTSELIEILGKDPFDATRAGESGAISDKQLDKMLDREAVFSKSVTEEPAAESAEHGYEVFEVSDDKPAF